MGGRRPRSCSASEVVAPQDAPYPRLAVGAVPITPAQQARILGANEGHFLDFKAKEIGPGKLTKAISAFANADGGELYIGIGEDRSQTHVGEGLNTAFEAMRKLKLKEPLIEEKANSVFVIIRHEPVSPPEVLVVEYLDTHDQITNRIARELCHIGSENRMKRIFEKLITQGRIERVPGLQGNRTAYQKVTT